MACSRCDREAILHVAYSGQHLCEAHFRESVERRVRRRIRTDELLGPSATPEDPARWLVGLSGGKDSAVLTTILQETFAEDPRVELVALTVHEGIEGYRDESLAACEALVEELAVPHEVVTYREEFGVEMDRVVEDDPKDMAACAYCGVFRRDVLARYATELDADLLLTGHNLDDEAQTALMNLLEGDTEQAARHFDASLAPIPERSDQDSFVPRAKPLRDVPEREVALYAHVRDLPAHVATCPHASEAYRGEIQEMLFDLEEHHPGTRHALLSGYEDLAALAAERREDPDRTLEPCDACGEPTARERCRTCELLGALGAESRPGEPS